MQYCINVVCFNFNVVSIQGNKYVQLSVSTMSNNNSHVETKVSYDPETTSLCTSTKTSDCHSTQSTGYTEAEPQKYAESKTEASKISGYYSDQSDSARPTSEYKTGVFCGVHLCSVFTYTVSTVCTKACDYIHRFLCKAQIFRTRI